MSERSHRHNPAAHSRSWQTRVKRGGPSLTHRPDPTANPMISFASVPRQRWVPNRGNFLEKRDRRIVELFHRKKLTVHANFPLKDIACVLLAQTKDTKIVCVIGCQITRTWIHTLLKRLASSRHNNREKTVLLPDCTLQTDQSVKTKKMMMYSPGAPYTVVTGCRRPTGGVFVYVCFRHRVTLTAFPIATPRGRSASTLQNGIFY